MRILREPDKQQSVGRLPRRLARIYRSAERVADKAGHWKTWTQTDQEGDHVKRVLRGYAEIESGP